MRVVSVFTCVSILATIAACGRPSETPKSGLKHETKAIGPFVDRDDLKLTKSPFYWKETTLSEYIHFAAPPPEFFSLHDAIVAESSPSVQLLQNYMDAADAYVRAETNLAGNSDVPKPKLVIVPSNDENAFATGVQTCINIPLTVPFADASARDYNNAQLRFTGVSPAWDTDPFTGKPLSCLDSKWEGQAQQFVEWFNAIEGPCKLKNTATGFELVDSNHCELNGVKSAKKLTFFAQTNYIYLSSALASTMNDPDQLGAILLHEMGHYYRAHAVTYNIAPLYNYYYQEQVGITPQKPKAVANNAELMKEALDTNPEVHAAFLKKLQTQRLSLYTVEQEADDISLEFLTAIGIDPKTAPQSVEKVLKTAYASAEDFEKYENMTSEECLSANANQWTDYIKGTLTDNRIPLMGLDDPHHTYCYRIFNFYRELASHSYEVLPRKVALPSSEQWAAFQAEMSRLNVIAKKPRPEF